MESTQSESVWTPKFTTDLEAVSTKAFEQLLQDMKAYFSNQPLAPLPAMLEQNGWCDITPEVAEKLFQRNKQNRKVRLETVRKYGRIMKAGRWIKTGQPGIMSNGELYDMQHRLLAGYFTGATFNTYMIVDVPPDPYLFAYIDDNAPRTPADIIQISGQDGMAGTIASAIKFAWHYENRALSILRAPTIRKLTNIEVLRYLEQHPEMGQGCHEMASNYGNAFTLIKNKGIAGFVAAKILELHGSEELESFMNPLGSGLEGGTDLDETNPIHGLRVRLKKIAEDDDEIKPLHLLALIIKAFNLSLDGTALNRRGLRLSDNERFPLFEDMIESDAAAA